jgi:hypothetical protein
MAAIAPSGWAVAAVAASPDGARLALAGCVCAPTHPLVCPLHAVVDWAHRDARTHGVALQAQGWCGRGGAGADAGGRGRMHRAFTTEPLGRRQRRLERSRHLDRHQRMCTCAPICVHAPRRGARVYACVPVHACVSVYACVCVCVCV